MPAGRSDRRQKNRRGMAHQLTICAVMAECFGSRNLSDESRQKALTLEPEVKAMAADIAKRNNINLTAMSRTQLQTIVNGWAAIPGFTKVYGTTEQIMNNFKPLPARGSQ